MREDIFAATVIMRVMAELEGTISPFGLSIGAWHLTMAIEPIAKDNGGRLEDHFLSGLQLCVQHQKTMLRQGSLGAAAFWVSLRQEIYNAVANQVQVSMLKMDVLPDIINNSRSPTDDYTWANQAVVHCAEVLNYCFGPVMEKSPEKWEVLNGWNKRWSVETAATFTPIYREGGEASFPEIWYTQSCHGTSCGHAQLLVPKGHCH